MQNLSHIITTTPMCHYEHRVHSSVRHHHPSLQLSSVVVSETVLRLPDLRKARVFHFLCSTLYIAAMHYVLQSIYLCSECSC